MNLAANNCAFHWAVLEGIEEPLVELPVIDAPVSRKDGREAGSEGWCEGRDDR